MLKNERNSNMFLYMKKELRSRWVPENWTKSLEQDPLNLFLPSTVYNTSCSTCLKSTSVKNKFKQNVITQPISLAMLQKYTYYIIICCSSTVAYFWGEGLGCLDAIFRVPHKRAPVLEGVQTTPNTDDSLLFLPYVVYQ